MKKNKKQSKSSDNVRKTRSEQLSNQTDGNAKKGRKVQKKIQKTTSGREIFQVVLPGIRYCDGQWIKKKTIEVIDLSVMKSASEDMEGIGNERLVLWKMSAEETEELKQQVKQEALHKKRENIMPLVMQMSKDQIETAYEGIVKQWNILDNLPSEECEDKNNCDDNTSDEETKGEKQLQSSAEVFSLDSNVSLAYDNSGCDVVPGSEYSELDDKQRSSADDLRVCDEGKSPLAEVEFCCDSVGVIVQQLASTEAAGLKPANGDNSQIVLQSVGESPVTTQIKPDQFPGEDFVAPLLIQTSLVSKPSNPGNEVSRKFQDSNSEVTESKESGSELVSDKSQLDDCISHSAGNQSVLCSSIPDSVVTNDHSFTNVRTTISAAEISVSDSASAAAAAAAAAAASDTRNTEIPDIKNDLNLCPKLIKRKRSTKAKKNAKKMKFYVDDLPSLVSESLKKENQGVILTTDCASDNNSAMIPTNTNTFIASTIDQIAQGVAPNKEPGLECTASIKECSTSMSINCDVKKSSDVKTETQMKDLSVDPRRSPNKSNDHVNLEPKIGAELKPLEVHENVVSCLQPTHSSKSVPNMSKPDLGTEKIKNKNKEKNTNGSCRRRDHKQRNNGHVDSRSKDSAKGCVRNLKSAQKNHLNLALDKKKISGKVSDKTFEPVTNSLVHYQVAGKDLHVSEDVSQHAVLGSKVSFSELTASQVKHKTKTRKLPMLEESKMKDVIPLDSQRKQKRADKLSSLVLEQGKVNTNSNAQKVITANHANRHQVKAVQNQGKKEIANDLKLCQPQVRKYNRKVKTRQKSSPCDIGVDVNSGNITSSTTTCNLVQTEIHGSNNKIKDGNQDSDLHQTETCTSTDKRKVRTKNTKLCLSEIIESCSNRNFTSRNLDHCYAEIIYSSDSKTLTANESGPSQTEIIKSSSETKDLGLLQIEVTGVGSGSREDIVRDLSMNQKSSKSSAVLHTISANSKHEKAHKRTPKKLQSKSSREEDWDKDTQSQENLCGRTSSSAQNELDAKFGGHISLDTNKTELDYTNHDSTHLGKNQNDKIPCAETKDDTETDKLEVLAKCNVKLETSKHDSQKDKNCCNTAAAQIEATVLGLNSFPVAEKLIDHMEVHAADDPTSRSSNHGDIQHVAHSLNICSSAVEEQMKGDQSVQNEHNREHIVCKPENSFCHPVSQLTEPREIDLKESHCTNQLMAPDDSIVSRNEHLVSQSKDDSSEVKSDSWTSSDLSKNDCLATRSGNLHLLDYSDSSNSELPDCGRLLSDEVISSINNNWSNKASSPICSPSPHSPSSPSSKVDHRQYVNGRLLRLKEPVAIPLMVEDPKVQNLLECMCKAEILRLLSDD